MSNRKAREALNGFDLAVEDDAWEEVFDLLTAGKYASAARVLEETEGTARRNGDATVHTVLEAARQICLAGDDFQAAVAFHKDAYKAASERERQLRRQLLSIVRLIAPASALPEGLAGLDNGQSDADAAQRREIPGLLQKLQDLLGFRLAQGNQDTHNTDIGLALPQVAAAMPQRNGEARPAPQHAAREDARLEGMEPRARSGPALAVHCLGAFAVYQDDQLIRDWNGLKGLTILKYLVAQGGKPVSKEVLMEVLWPSGDPEAARRNLHQAVYSLRQALRHHAPDFQHILFQNDAYHFNSNLRLWIDFVEFERHVRRGQQHEATGNVEEAMSAYAAAEELYRGDFLEEDPYEEWAVAQRERLRANYLGITDRLAAYYVERQKYTAGMATAQRALRHDPYYEAAHRWLMRCFMAQGQRHLAVRQYQICADLLANELELPPSAKTVRLYEKIKGIES